MRLPTGTVTFLFSDVEGSTRRLERDRAEAGRALASHHGIFQSVVTANRGVIFETVGDAVYAAFARSSDAAVAAVAAHRALAENDWEGFEPLRVRIAIHTGEVESRGRHYFGPALFRCARLQALGWGGQTLISAATEQLVRGGLPTEMALRDRGEHELKDLVEPEHVFELVDETSPREFPALRTTTTHPNNLPDQLSSFVGRDAELAALASLVRLHQLVTVTGPGGTGKTRLAIEAAARLLDTLPDGVWFVDLAPARRLEDVAMAIGSTLGVAEQPPAPLQETLKENLRPKRLLLVLDNFEQVVETAPMVSAIVAASDVRVIVTSREPLRLRGEQEFSLSPLVVPRIEKTTTNEEFEQSPSIRLFVDRAREVVPDFAASTTSLRAVAEICRRLDGLPLGIELAAALMRLMTPEQMLHRLESRLDVVASQKRDVPERQRTLRAALSWSHELLSPEESRAFAALAVFIDGFTLAGADAVIGDPSVDVLGRVGALLDKSLLVRSFDSRAEARFRMLETVREFAAERLRESGDFDERKRALAAWARRIVAPEGVGLRWSEAMATVAQFESERNNIVEAIRWFDEAGFTNDFIELVSATSAYWLAGARLTEARPWLARAEEVWPDQPTVWTAHLLRNAASIEHQLGASSWAFDLIDRSITDWIAIGNKAGLADALRLKGVFALDRGDLEEARVALTEAESIALAVGDDHTRRACLADLSAVAIEMGDYTRSEELMVDLLEASNRVGDRWGSAIAHGNLAYAHFLRGDLTRAEVEGRTAADYFGELDRKDFLGWSLQNVAGVVAEAGRFGEARDLALRALRLCADIGIVKDVSSCLDTLAGVELGSGKPAIAVRLMVGARRIRASAELSLGRPEGVRVAEQLARARMELGEDYEAVAADAETVPIDDIIREQTDAALTQTG